MTSEGVCCVAVTTRVYSDTSHLHYRSASVVSTGSLTSMDGVSNRSTSPGGSQLVTVTEESSKYEGQLFQNEKNVSFKNILKFIENLNKNLNKCLLTSGIAMAYFNLLFSQSNLELSQMLTVVFSKTRLR